MTSQLALNLVVQMNRSQDKQKAGSKSNRIHRMHREQADLPPHIACIAVQTTLYTTKVKLHLCLRNTICSYMATQPVLGDMFKPRQLQSDASMCIKFKQLCETCIWNPICQSKV